MIPSLPILQTTLTASDGCHRCPLHRDRVKVVPGEGDPNARLLIVGEAPGRQEDEQGRPFVGDSGALLDRLLSRLPLVGTTALNRTQGVFITNVCRCRPPMNRTPASPEIEACTPFFWRTLNALPNVRVIVALGNTPLRFLAQDALARITHRRGKWFNRVYEGRALRIMPTFHPSYLLRLGPAATERTLVWADMLEVVSELNGLAGHAVSS
jgi:DNA polymerase